MIIGIGVDIIAVSRITEVYQKYQNKFLDKLLTSNEQQELQTKTEKKLYLAGRWAAKEAVGKALQSGISCGFKNIEVLTANNGAPLVELHGLAQEIAHNKEIKKIHISISHEQEYAIAYVIAEG